MNVFELLGFTRWMDEHGVLAHNGYNQLASVLNHNASQPDKQVVTDPLNALLEILRELPLEQLTLEQERMLQHLGIDEFIGHSGSRFVEQTVRTSNFDPATAAARVAEAKDAIGTALKRIQNLRSALEGLDFVDELDAVDADGITLRVQFKDDAAISNVVDLKQWSSEWHDIVRGVALCVNEAPEGARVVGATNGSLIVILSATLGVVTLMALITKHVSSMIKEGLVIASAAEDLKQKRIYTEVMREELRKLQADNEKNGIEKIVEAVRKELPNTLDGEQLKALQLSVEKFLKFNKRGGELDFVEPTEGGEDSTEGEEAAVGVESEEIAALRHLIEEVRVSRAELKLLTSDAPVGAEDDDKEDD